MAGIRGESHSPARATGGANCSPRSTCTLREVNCRPKVKSQTETLTIVIGAIRDSYLLTSGRPAGKSHAAGLCSSERGGLGIGDFQA